MSGDFLQVRPRRAVCVAVAAAVILIGLFTANAVVLPQTTEGVYLRPSGQVGMGLIGVLLAGGALLFARPRLRADEHGVAVRNLLVTRVLPWELVLDVSFPDGAAWARLELPDDEYVPVMAVQAADRGHAVRAVRSLRALHAEHAPTGHREDR